MKYGEYDFHSIFFNTNHTNKLKKGKKNENKKQKILIEIYIPSSVILMVNMLMHQKRKENVHVCQQLTKLN